MFVVGGGPGLEDGECRGLVAEDERTDGEFGGTETGEEAEGVDGGGDIVEAVLGDAVGEEDADEVVADARGEGAEDGELFAVGERECEGDAGGGATHAVHELAGGQVGERVVEERGRVEDGGERGEFGCERAVARGVEHVF